MLALLTKSDISLRKNTHLRPPSLFNILMLWWVGNSSLHGCLGRLVKVNLGKNCFYWWLRKCSGIICWIQSWGTVWEILTMGFMRHCKESQISCFQNQAYIWDCHGGWEPAYMVVQMCGKSSLLYQAWRADGVIGIVIRPAPKLPVSEPVIILMSFPSTIASRSQQERIQHWVRDNS